VEDVPRRVDLVAEDDLEILPLFEGRPRAQAVEDRDPDRRGPADRPS
jgi:hypothetical protein